jgi:hypothetical protein
MNFCESDDKKLNDLEKKLISLVGEEEVFKRRTIVENNHGNCSTLKNYKVFIEDYIIDLTRNIKIYESINGKKY